MRRQRPPRPQTGPSRDPSRDPERDPSRDPERDTDRGRFKAPAPKRALSRGAMVVIAAGARLAARQEADAALGRGDREMAALYLELERWRTELLHRLERETAGGTGGTTGGTGGTGGTTGAAG